MNNRISGAMSSHCTYMHMHFNFLILCTTITAMYRNTTFWSATMWVPRYSSHAKQLLLFTWNIVSRTYKTPDLTIKWACWTQSFFPGLFFYDYIERPNPKKPRRPHSTGPTPQAPNPSTESPGPKNLIQDPNPQTTINEQKWEKCIKNNPWKKSYIAGRTFVQGWWIHCYYTPCVWIC